MTDNPRRYVGGQGHITRHLFVLAINNSGSTFLTRALGMSPGAWSLPREAQHVPGFAGPSSRGTGTGLLWAARPESEALFTDPVAYDWQKNRRAWHFQAEASDLSASVLVLSSPPFLLIANELATAFPDARFLIMTRHPLPVIEGILRGTAGKDCAARLALVDQAVAHVTCGMERQLANRQVLADRAISISYEDMCASPAAVSRAIEDFVPELGVVDVNRRLPVKGQYDEALRDMNQQQVERLGPALRETIEARLVGHQALFEQFGYGAALP